MKVTVEWKKAGAINGLTQWHSDAMNIIPLLLDIPGINYPCIGWFLGGRIMEFRQSGSPSPVIPLHWMVLPHKP